MIRLLLSVIGEPGVGKSTAVGCFWRALGTARSVQYSGPRLPTVARLDAHNAELGVEVGVDRSEFPGTDGLSMSILPTACEWIADYPARLVVAEGDRLASARFYAAARSTGRKVLVVWLKDPVAAAQRRAARGSRQDEQWIKTRQTKVRRLALSQGAIEMPAERAPMRLGLDLALMVEAIMPITIGDLAS
jgi:hypothetical protein